MAARASSDRAWNVSSASVPSACTMSGLASRSSAGPGSSVSGRVTMPRRYRAVAARAVVG